MDTLKERIDTEVFAENLMGILQEVRDYELTLGEQEKVLDELNDLEERMRELKKSLLDT